MMCPSCAAQVPPVIWRLVAGFVVAPFAIVAVVAALVVGAIRRADAERPLRLPPARPTSVPPDAERSRDGARLA